jgi:hypothetical protein
LRTSWTEETALSLLKNWIDEGKWDGTVHFRRHNSSLYEYIYRSIGFYAAFERLGLDYADFKKNKGKQLKNRNDKVVIHELQTLMNEGKWKDVRHLQVNHSRLYRELSRIGFPEAFHRIGLDYKTIRNARWDKENILIDLKDFIDRGEWEGVSHLKKHNSKLYNAINRNIGFSKAFSELGLTYDQFKKFKG